MSRRRTSSSCKTTTDGNYGGLGLTVSIEDGAVKVIAPTEDTPAGAPGIKAGDYITHIDGELIYGFSSTRRSRRCAATRARAIKLTIVRPGRDKPFDVTMSRERIELEPVKWEVKDGVGDHQHQHLLGQDRRRRPRRR